MKRYFRIIVGIFILICLIQNIGIGQGNDRYWQSIRLRKPLSNKLKLDFRPVIRFGHNLGSYDNISFDLVLHYKINKAWNISFLERTWFLDDGSNRQFLWLRLSHNFITNGNTFTNAFLLHGALDIQDKMDPDFLRWKIIFKPKVPYKWKPFFAFEPWWRFSGENGIERLRYETGINHKFTNRILLAVMYRREEWVNFDIDRKLDVLLITLTYVL